MINKRRKKHVQRVLDIPAIVIFIIVITIYTFTGNGTHNESITAATDAETLQTATDAAVSDKSLSNIPLITSDNKHLDNSNKKSADASTISVTASAVPDHSASIADSTLDGLSSTKVSVLLSNENIVYVPLETYVARVVASEMPSSFSYEALKAQAVAARTYVEGRRIQFENGKSKHKEACVCASTCCQVYRSDTELRSIKSDEWYENDFNIIKNAVLDTAGEMLCYNDELVQQPLFFSSAGGGKTENSEDVFTATLPYLRSVDSLYDSPKKYTNKISTLPLSEVMSKVNDYTASHSSAVTIISESSTKSSSGASDSGSSSGAPNSDNPTGASGAPVKNNTVEVLSRTEGGGAALVRFGGVALTGRQVRSLFSLPSADMDITEANGSVTFTTRGSGHRVGMSQYGADGMASRGYTYKEILSHYYSGTEVKKLSVSAS